MKKLITLLLLGSIYYSSAQDAKTTRWEAPYVGSSQNVLYLPDANAVYWRYGWETKMMQNKGIIIKGKFPDARYFSYNVYDDNTKSSIGSIADFTIKPDDSKNNYTIYIVPEDSKIKAANVIYYNKNIEKVSVILRHYLPNNNIFGNQALPSIKIYNVISKTIEESPSSLKVPKFSKEDIQKYLIPLFEKIKENPDEYVKLFVEKIHQKTLNVEELICKQLTSNAFKIYNPNGIINSYNMNSDGTYPNNDNHYLTMPIIRNNKNDVCLIKFRAIKYPKIKKENNVCDVRYFSISQGDELTYNHSTLADYQLKVNPDGFIYIIIGNDSKELENKAKSLNINFMPWLVNDKMLLIYRNMLPSIGFKYGANNVPKINPSKELKSQIGSNFIGDYSPVGQFFNYEDFLKSNTIPNF